MQHRYKKCHNIKNKKNGCFLFSLKGFRNVKIVFKIFPIHIYNMQFLQSIFFHAIWRLNLNLSFAMHDGHIWTLYCAQVVWLSSSTWFYHLYRRNESERTSERHLFVLLIPLSLAEAIILTQLLQKIHLV
jgi:hypothetical protein